MNTNKKKEKVSTISPKKRNLNSIERQYNQVLGKKDTYSDNEIFVFNAIRNAQKILERYKD